MSQRSNQDWLDELRGDRGQAQQHLTYQELSRYLYVVVFNYLKMRQSNLPALAGFAPEELAALAEDFVQETLEKLARDDHALLNQFGGHGRFLSWVTQIARNQAGQELRKVYWHRRASLPEEEQPEPEDGEWSPSFTFPALVDDANPETIAMRQRVAETLQGCIEELQERRRLAFWGCVAEERSAQHVANALDTTENAVFLLVHRAKNDLRKCLEKAGLDQSILEVFAE